MWEDKTLSFSSNVKSELSHHFGNARHCNIAELAAILNMCGHIAYNRDKICVKIQTENPAAARKYFTLLKKTFNIDSEVLTRRNSQLKKNMEHSLPAVLYPIRKKCIIWNLHVRKNLTAKT